MTPASRVYTAVAAFAAMHSLACAPRSPAAITASTPATHASRPPREPDQPKVGVTTVQPESKPLELRCDDLQLLPDDLDWPSKHQMLSVLVRTAATPHELTCLRRTIERFFPVIARERPPPDDPADLPDWWHAAYYADADPKVLVIMPEPAPNLSGAAETRLAPLLCSNDNGSCGAEARVFLADAEARMAELANLTRLEALVDDAREHVLPSADDAIESCAEDALKLPREAAFSEWRGCVTALVPRLVRVPSGSFKMPAQGVVIARRSGYWDPCAEVTGFSLASGLTLTRMDCTLPKVNRDVRRWKLSRALPSGVRRVALFIGLMDQMRSGPAFVQAFPVPDGISPEEPRYVRSAPSLMLNVSDAPTFDYSVHGVLAEPLSGRVYAYREVEPRKRFLAKLLHTSHAIGVASCAGKDDRLGLTELLARMFPGESDLRSMEEQVTQAVSCQ